MEIFASRVINNGVSKYGKNIIEGKTGNCIVNSKATINVSNILEAESLRPTIVVLNTDNVIFQALTTLNFYKDKRLICFVCYPVNF